ncbi:MAG: hypothetical protein MZV63_72245 [Marinilabiliales bacterium]|nr:hypothetical protein [Marinilabiliales bacterium]
MKPLYAGAPTTALVPGKMFPPSMPAGRRRARPRLTQVLVNLLSNASKYSPMESTIDLRTGKTRTAKFCASQSATRGPGIPLPEPLETLPAASRVWENRKSAQYGVGLGPVGRQKRLSKRIRAKWAWRNASGRQARLSGLRFLLAGGDVKALWLWILTIWLWLTWYPSLLQRSRYDVILAHDGLVALDRWRTGGRPI